LKEDVEYGTNHHQILKVSRTGWTRGSGHTLCATAGREMSANLLCISQPKTKDPGVPE